MARRKVAREKFTDAELDAMANFGPAITDDDMHRMEEGAQGFGIERRLTLIALARDANTLSQMSLDDPESFAEMLGGIESFRDHAKALLHGAEHAVLRMKIADCRSAALAVTK